MVMNCALSKLSRNWEMHQKQQQQTNKQTKTKNKQTTGCVRNSRFKYDPCLALLKTHISVTFYVRFPMGKCVEIFNTQNNSVLQLQIYVFFMSQIVHLNNTCHITPYISLLC